MKEISLTRGLVALVDDADFDWLNQWKWYAKPAKKTFYAARRNSETGRILKMHQMILPGVPVIDHENGNGLNNQRGNLRPATDSQSQANRGIQANNTSGFKGAYWHEQTRKWMASITAKKHQYFLGLFSSPKEAARAYDAAAIKFFGKFARPNFPQTQEQPKE